MDPTVLLPRPPPTAVGTTGPARTGPRGAVTPWDGLWPGLLLDCLASDVLRVAEKDYSLRHVGHCGLGTQWVLSHAKSVEHHLDHVRFLCEMVHEM